MRNYVLYATSLIVIKMSDKERAVVDIVFYLLSICVLDLENSKNINFSLVETPRLTWHNLFAHRSTRSAVSSQIDQNAPGQPSVDWKSKLVKIITKQHFSCFYIKSELLRDFCQFWLSLTWGWLLESPKTPNFDSSFKTGWGQHHCKDYGIQFPTIIHGPKLELKWNVAHQHASWGHNFWSDHWNFNFF